jgi:hypothetical protein
MSDSPKRLDGYPYADTDAAFMLASAIYRTKRERGISLRSLAKHLNYKQATVLSHMANGRIVVPLDRAAEIARAVELNPAEFLLAAVDQRSRGAADLLSSLAGSGSVNENSFISELKLIAGHSVDSLSDDQKQVAREVVADEKPQRRWLSLAELPVMHLLRQLRPDISRVGLSARP